MSARRRGRGQPPGCDSSRRWPRRPRGTAGWRWPPPEGWAWPLRTRSFRPPRRRRAAAGGGAPPPFWSAFAQVELVAVIGSPAPLPDPPPTPATLLGDDLTDDLG